MPTAANETGGYESPEAGALAGWHESGGSQARVISTQIIGDRAEVLVEAGIEPPYQDWCYFIRLHGSWHEAVSGSAPCDRWWDPEIINWS